MKKAFAILLTLTMALSLLAACGGKQETPAQTEQSAQPAALSGTVSTNGSTSMEKVIGALSEQFMTDNSGVSVTYDATGSGAGIEAASNGSADIGLSSRALIQASWSMSPASPTKATARPTAFPRRGISRQTQQWF